ncbi:MAG: metallophosphoesterase family protein [Thermomicrobiales bacterium]
MTRVAVIADIHGNLPALEAVLADLAQFEVDHLVAAGDLINWGPFSAQVVERAIAEGWAVIRGNHEYYLLDYDTPRAHAAWADPDHFSTLPWLRRQLGARLHARIAAWPDTITLRPPDAPPLRVVHGTPRSPWEPINPWTPPEQLAEILAGVAEETIVTAHIHMPLDRQFERWHIVNPGSVGLPLDGTWDASYLILDGDATGWRATFRRVPFSNEAIYAEFARQGFVAECGVVGELIIEEFRTSDLQIVPFLRWRAATCPDAPFSPDTLAQFRALPDRKLHLPSRFREGYVMQRREAASQS